MCVMVTDNAIGDVGYTTLQRTQLHRTAAGLPRLNVLTNGVDTSARVSLDSHSGVSAVEHFGLGALAAPGKRATVYRGAGFVGRDIVAGKSSLLERFKHGPLDPHKATSGGHDHGYVCQRPLPVFLAHTHTPLYCHTTTRWHGLCMWPRAVLWRLTHA